MLLMLHKPSHKPHIIIVLIVWAFLFDAVYNIKLNSNLNIFETDKNAVQLWNVPRNYLQRNYIRYIWHITCESWMVSSCHRKTRWSPVLLKTRVLWNITSCKLVAIERRRGNQYVIQEHDIHRICNMSFHASIVTIYSIVPGGTTYHWSTPHRFSNF